MAGFFSVCCGEGEEEEKFGAFVDVELAKEMGWDAPPQDPGSKEIVVITDGERIRKIESQISLVNKHRPSDEDLCESLLCHDRKAVFCQPINLDDSFMVPFYDKSEYQKKFLDVALQDNFLFTDLTSSEKDEFVGAMQNETYEVGAIIIVQGDKGDYFYIVESGEVDFIDEEDRSDNEASTTTSTKVGSCCAGGSFGELALLYESPRAVSCVASGSEPVSVWKVDQKTFRYVLAQSASTHHSKLKELVQKVSLFKELNSHTVSRFVKSLTPVSWSVGQRIVQKGEEGSIFYIIQEGQVKVHDIGLGDSEVEELVLRPGDWFGERALLTGEPRAANVTAITQVTTLAMDRGTFETCIGPLRGLIERAMRKQSLQGLPIFANSNIDDKEVDELVGLMEEVCYRKGDKLAESGKPYKMNLWIIRHGKLVVYSEKHDNLYTMMADGYFGDKSLKGDIDHISSHTAICEENLTTWLLTREQIESVIGDVDRLGNSTAFRKTSSMPKLIPFSHLKIHDMLGQGAFGKVYMVSDSKNTESESVFALKAISKVKVIDAKMQNAVVREKELLSILEHPFILNLVSSYQDEDNLYLLLPLLLGGELFSLLHKEKSHRRGMKNSWAAFYSACIVEALGHFGKYNIAFRDLKLENVLLDADGYGVIVDLGFAKVVAEKTYTLCGTPEYLAPEIIMSRGHDQAVDYWATGILMFELLVGHSPFFKRGSSQMELFKRIVVGKYKSPEYVSSKASDLIEKLLVRNQAKRLGNLANGCRDVQCHPWFEEAGLSFKEVRRKQIQAPWEPNITGARDTANFDNFSDSAFGRETSRRLTKEEQELFIGF